MNKVGWVRYEMIYPGAEVRILVGYDQDVLYRYRKFSKKIN